MRACALEIDGSVRLRSLWRARPTCRSAGSGSRSSRAGCRARPRAAPTERLPPQCAQRWASGAFSPAHFGHSMGDAMMTDGRSRPSILSGRPVTAIMPRAAARRTRMDACRGPARLGGRGAGGSRASPACVRAVPVARRRSTVPPGVARVAALAAGLAAAALVRRRPRLPLRDAARPLRGRPGRSCSWSGSGLHARGCASPATSRTTCSWRRASGARATSTCATTSRARTGASTRRGRSRRTTARRGADGRPFPAHSPGLPCCWRPLYALGGRAPLRGRAGPGRRRRWASRRGGAARRAHRRRGGGAARLGAGRWAARSSFYSFHVYTEVPVGAGRSPVALRLLLGGPGVAGGRRRGAAGLGPAVAARQDDPRRGRAGGVVAVVHLRGRPLGRRSSPSPPPWPPAFSPTTTRSSAWPRRSRSTAGVPRDAAARRCARWPACCSTARSACLPYAPVFLLALAGLAALVASPGLGAPARGSGRARCPCCRGGCGGAGSARPRASWCPLVPLLALRPGRAGRGHAHGARALALASALPRSRDHDRR